MTASITKEELTVEIYDTLADMGIPSQLLGYDCIHAAIPLVVQAEPMGRIYKKVAILLDLTPASVERNIRTAAAASIKNLSQDDISRIYGNSLNWDSGTPTNAQLLVTAARRIYGMGVPVPMRAVRSGKKTN